MLLVIPLLRTGTRVTIALLCSVYALWPSSFAHAEERMQKELLASPEYLRAIEQAVESFDAARYGESHEHFSRAHAIVPNARTLRGLGMVELELGRRAAAARHFELALASDVLPLAGEQRAATEASLSALWLQLARVQVAVEPANASVRVAGNLVTSGQTLVLEPGSYEVEAACEGFVRKQETLQVAAADHRRLELRLAPVSSIPDAPAVAAVTPPVVAPAEAAALVAPSVPAPSAPPRPERVARGPWFVVAGGALSAGTGAALSWMAQRQKSRVQDAPVGSEWSAYADDARSYPRFQAGGLALLGTGIAGIAGGLIWYSVLRRHSSAHVTLGPQGARLVGQF
jgi:hypothetical protein